MKTIGKYTFFWKDKIGQWNMKPFKDNEGIIYVCAEQYMMAKKALLFNDIASYNMIMIATEPAKHQKIGRQIANFEENIWNKHKEDIVRMGNIFKFSQNEDLLEILLSTKGTQLVEASPYDRIWGIGMGVDEEGITEESNWRGQNLLGKILTEIRDNPWLFARKRIIENEK